MELGCPRQVLNTHGGINISPPLPLSLNVLLGYGSFWNDLFTNNGTLSVSVVYEHEMMTCHCTAYLAFGA